MPHFLIGHTGCKMYYTLQIRKWRNKEIFIQHSENTLTIETIPKSCQNKKKFNPWWNFFKWIFWYIQFIGTIFSSSQWKPREETVIRCACIWNFYHRIVEFRVFTFRIKTWNPVINGKTIQIHRSGFTFSTGEEV